MTTLNPEVGHVYAPRGKEGDTSTWERVCEIADDLVNTRSFSDKVRTRIYRINGWHAIDWVEITPAPVPPVDAVRVECAVMFNRVGGIHVEGHDGETPDAISIFRAKQLSYVLPVYIPPKRPIELPAVVVTGDGK